MRRILGLKLEPGTQSVSILEIGARFRSFPGEHVEWYFLVPKVIVYYFPAFPMTDMVDLEWLVGRLMG